MGHKRHLGSVRPRYFSDHVCERSKNELIIPLSAKESFRPRGLPLKSNKNTIFLLFGLLVLAAIIVVALPSRSQDVSTRLGQRPGDEVQMPIADFALPDPTDDESPLMRNLLRRGIVRPFINGQFHAGGIEINSDLNVIGGNGKPQLSLWALGTLVEGCKFYTFVLPRPYVNSTALVDAGRAVGKMVAMIRSGSNYKQVA